MFVIENGFKFLLRKLLLWNKGFVIFSWLISKAR